MTKILGIAGKKGSGKDSLCNFIHAVVLSNIFVEENNERIPLVDYARINEDGKIVVPTDNEEHEGILELTNHDPEFLQWMNKNVWQHVCRIAIADPLKEFLVNMFGLDWKILNGTDDEKNQPTNIKWSTVPTKMPKGSTKDTLITHREIMQFFGEYLRKWKSGTWESLMIDNARNSKSEVVIVPDVRHPIAVDMINAEGGKVVYLTRRPSDDGHSSETALTADYPGLAAVITNQDLSLEETHKQAWNLLLEWGFFEKGEVV
jgi:hypothetical protein